MIELPLTFLGGILGTAHCIGMCGGFAVSIGLGATSYKKNLQRQLIYSAGRIFTYSFLGCIAGYVGMRMAGDLTSLGNVQSILCIVAGVLLVVQGAYAMGLIPSFKKQKHGGAGCLAGTFFSSFLTGPGLWNVFIAGILTGFLPCGLVYAYLALAATGASLLSGMEIMLAFGLGTVPVMVLTGAGASLLNLKNRQKLFRLAAVCVALTGVLTINRGVSFLEIPGVHEAEGCPMCIEAEKKELTSH